MTKEERDYLMAGFREFQAVCGALGVYIDYAALSRGESSELIPKLNELIRSVQDLRTEASFLRAKLAEAKKR